MALTLPTGYYDRYDASKFYKTTLFIAGRGAQASELNELQDQIGRELLKLEESFFINDTFTRGGSTPYSIGGGNIIVSCDGGIFPHNGILHEVSPASVTCAASSVDELVIAITKTIITEVDDVTLRDPAVGTKNYAQAGAARYKYVAEWHLGSTAPVTSSTQEVDIIVMGNFTGSDYNDVAIAVLSDMLKVINKPIGATGLGTDTKWYSFMEWTLPAQYANFQTKLEVTGRASSGNVQYTLDLRCERGVSNFNIDFNLITPFAMCDSDQFKLCGDFATGKVTLYYNRAASIYNSRVVTQVTNYLDGGASLVYKNYSVGTIAPAGTQDVLMNNASCLVLLTTATAVELGDSMPIGGTGLGSSANWYKVYSWYLPHQYSFFQAQMRITGRPGVVADYQNVLYDIACCCERGATDFEHFDLKLVTPFAVLDGDRFKLCGDLASGKVSLYYNRATNDYDHRAVTLVSQILNYDATLSYYNSNEGSGTPSGSTVNIQADILTNCIAFGVSAAINMALSGTRLDITNTGDPGYVFGSELLSGTGWTTTGWTGSFAGGYIHTPGNTSALANSYAATLGVRYHIEYSIVGRSAGTAIIGFGGMASPAVSKSGVFDLVSISTGAVSVTPTSDFNGTVVLSLKEFA